jgi:hypothetical protein
MMTATSGCSSEIVRSRPKPFSPGMLTSQSTRSTGSTASSARPSAALAAEAHRYPASVSIRTSTRRSGSSSSTTSTLAVRVVVSVM